METQSLLGKINQKWNKLHDWYMEWLESETTVGEIELGEKGVMYDGRYKR